MLDKERSIIRAGLAVMACLLALNLAGPLTKLLSIPEVASLLLYLETGRVVKLELLPPEETEPPAPTETVPSQTELPPRQVSFLETDADLVQVSPHWNC